LPTFFFQECSYADLLLDNQFSALSRFDDIDLMAENVELVGRTFKPHIRVKEQDDVDPFTKKWLLSNGADLSLYSLYRQTDPDLHSVWKDFQKYSKPDVYFDDVTLDKAFDFAVQHFFPFVGGSDIWTHEQCVETWEPLSSNGIPWNMSIPLAKDFIPIYGKELPKLWDEFVSGVDPCVLWNVSPKYEIRSAAKISERKIRTFTAAPKHFTYIMQKLGSDFNQRFYNSHSATWSKVGMTMFHSGWDELMNRMLKFPCHLELDGEQYDSSMREKVQRLLCRFRKMCLNPKYRGAYNACFDRIYDEVIHGLCVLPGGFVFRKKNGGPSGGAYTTVDNTIYLYILFAKTVIECFQEVGVDITYADYNSNMIAAMYGDDNNVGMTEEWAKVLTPERILRVSARNGLKLKSEHSVHKPVTDLCFLNMSTVKRHGRWVPVPNTAKMRGSLLHNPGSHVQRFLRLCGLRIICWWNDELLPDIEGLISSTRAILMSSLDVVDKASGFTARQAFGAYITKGEMLDLWFGMESSVASVKKDRFKSMPMDRICQDLFVNEVFDSTLGYPGEGPLTDVFSKARFKYHGNWGGPNYGAGKYLKPGEKPDWGVKPVDDLDASFRRHDYNYTRMSQRDADRLWLAEAESLPPSAKKQLAQVGFHVKSLGSDDITPHWSRRHRPDPKDYKYPWDEKEIDKHIELLKDEPRKTIEEKIVEVKDPPRIVTFDKTKGYEGEGPNGKKKMSSRKRSSKKPARLAKRRSKKAAKKVWKKIAKRASYGPRAMKGVPLTSLVRQPQGTVNLGTSRTSDRGSETLVLIDLNTIGATIPRFGNMFKNSAVSEGSLLPDLQYMDLNPYAVASVAAMYGLRTLLQDEAEHFEEWEASFRFEWKTSCGTNTNGQLMWWYDPDPADKSELEYNSQRLLAIAQQYGAKEFPMYKDNSVTIRSKGRKWLRFASGTDIRKASAGRFYFITNKEITSALYPQGIGQLLLHVNYRLHKRCARELNYEAYREVDLLEGQAAATHYVNFTGKRLEPYSGTVVPYGSDTMASPLALPGSNSTLVLNHDFTTPVATFIQFHIVLSGGPFSGSLAFNYKLGGVTSYLYKSDIVASSTSNLVGVWTIFIPAGTPPDAAQIDVLFILSGTGAVAGEWWTLPSVLFEGDFVSVTSRDIRSLTYREAQRLSQKDADESDEKSDSIVVEEPSRPTSPMFGAAKVIERSIKNGDFFRSDVDLRSRSKPSSLK
jgi:hypothetical protein